MSTWTPWLHAVYRCVAEPDGLWRGYILGEDLGENLSVTAESLPAARHALPEALLARARDWPWQATVEHLEHALDKRLWVREAVDAYAAERAHTSRVIVETLTDQRVLQQLHALPESPAGGVVVLACVPGDTLGWVCDQHGQQGALVVASAVANHALWWNVLLDADSAEAVETADLPTAATLADLDLTSPEATVDEWIAASDPGRLIVMPATDPRPATAATSEVRAAPHRAGAESVRQKTDHNVRRPPHPE